MTAFNPIGIRGLSFTGPNRPLVEVNFDRGLNLLFGASNTGKSFMVKVLDFMLGSSRPLPEIGEREGYDRAWLALKLPNQGEVTLTRALAGGAFELHANRVSTTERRINVRALSARHDHSNDDNVSQLLLNELGFGNRFIAVDANGNKRSLSFRDVIRFSLVDETIIQNETSPVEAGQYTTATAERSVFKLLLTGVDDSAVVPIVNKTVLKTQTNAKLEILDEMIANIDEKITADFHDIDGLAAQDRRLATTFEAAQADAQIAQDNIRAQLNRKREVAGKVAKIHQRLNEVELNLARFAQLEEVYSSDVQRLEAVEEAGFLLLLGSDKDCPLCGAVPDAQRHDHGIADIERIRAASAVEIEKIARHRASLSETIDELVAERETRISDLAEETGILNEVDEEIGRLSPEARGKQHYLAELTMVRDHVKLGLSLLAQKQSLADRRDELASIKPSSKTDKPRLGVSSTTAHEFAQTVSRVLEEWQFPGKRHVAFDETTYDLRIDGKHRRDNGKGVRAVTHAAFKVALLMFCRERGLPHPGFLVLDTPLLTYRDPIRSKEGPLAADERELQNTSLRDFFFEHLASLSTFADFVIVENIDPPLGIEKLGNTQVFTADPGSGRFGLFPNSGT
jgi:predicted nuclease with TOPRIM domain